MEPTPLRPKDGPSGLKRAWRRVRKPLAESSIVKSLLASSLTSFVRLVKMTNREAAGSDPIDNAFPDEPVIIALWHGQHIVAPALVPRSRNVIALVSRSTDAEMNAVVLENLGIKTIRGSGGREREKTMEKGGARALLALKRALNEGTNVVMIADIPHGEPRQAGEGIVTLARISGRPVVCVAFATSRRHVIEKSWDKTTINLPLGKYSFAIAPPIYVANDGDADELERKRVEITDTLNGATERAYKLVDSRS